MRELTSQEAEHLMNNIDELDEIGYQLFDIIAQKSSTQMLYNRLVENHITSNELYKELQDIFKEDIDLHDENYTMNVYDYLLFTCPKENILTLKFDDEPIKRVEDQLLKFVFGDKIIPESERNELIEYLKDIIMGYRHMKLVMELKNAKES